MNNPTAKSIAIACAVLLTACGGDSKSDPTGPTGPGGPTGPTVTTGTISGRVTHASTGAGLAGATVTTQPATSTATTDAQGNYTIANVTAGAYTVSVSMSGYTAATTMITVVAGQTGTANVSLTPVPAASGLSYTQLFVINGPTDGIASAAVSPDGRWIAWAGYGTDLTVHLVDASTRQEVRRLSGHTRPVTELAFSPDSRFLVTTGTVNLPPGTDGSVRLWEVSTGTQLGNVATPGTSWLTFSPDGTRIFGASGGDPVSIRVWSGTNLTAMSTISGVFRFAAVSPDGSRVASGARNELLHIVNAATGASMTTYSGQTGWVTAAAFSATGNLLASAAEDRSIRIRDASTGTINRTLTGHTSYPDLLFFSPDATVLASVGSGLNITRTSSGGISISLSSADRLLRLWNLTTGAELPRVNTASDVLSAVSFSRDWRLLVTGADGGSVRVFQRN